jgi:hypothetical protein
VTHLNGIHQLDALLAKQPHRDELRPPASAALLGSVADALGVEVPSLVKDFYSLHDGVYLEAEGHPGFYVFPPWWECMPLEVIRADGRLPVSYGRTAGLDVFPFAVDAAGAFLAATTDDRVWCIADEPPTPAWPDGTASGLISATIAAYENSSTDFRLDHQSPRMRWISSWEPEF